MRIRLAPTLKGYKLKYLLPDLLAGLIIMAVSIPISMGYAQIAGLPPVYGLYGSVFPILIFSLISTSRQFIFGVDAAPAALIGAAILDMGITHGSEDAMRVVPMLTFFVAAWLLIFYILKAGKFVNFISSPVMGGFITGICCTIILMQIPKLMGGTSGTGEFLELTRHIFITIKSINLYSLLLGVVALAILLISKKFIPKFPMAVVLMAGSILLTRSISMEKYGIATLSAVNPGLPSWQVPNFTDLVPIFGKNGEIIPTSINLSEVIIISLSVAVVIMAETLLAEHNFAGKNNYRIDDNQELLAFALGNMAGAFTGCCPINGSVSRTAMSEQYQGKTQLTGLVAGASMIGVLLFATDFIQYLPVPVLTAIVISALMGATEFHLAKRLWKISRAEFFIFIGAFLGVLMLGTINGVLIGVLLSFIEMIIRSSNPARCFLGIQPGHKHFHDTKHDHIVPIQDVIIYRFSSSLFFANCDIFQSDVDGAVASNTRGIIIDARGVGSIDITAADRIKSMYENYKKQGIRFYLTEHSADLNNQLRNLGLGYMVEEGAVRRTIHIALKDMGINRPYPLEGVENNVELSAHRKRADNKMQEFHWAYGNKADDIIEKQIQRAIAKVKETGDINEAFKNAWHYMNEMDEDEWIEHLEEHLKELVSVSGMDEVTLTTTLAKHRHKLIDNLQ